jgi:AraC-like DNA-binding protein/DNA gyrase inhibitor GyrI
MKERYWLHRIEQIKIYIDDNIQSKIDLKETAEHFDVSYYRFLHLFKEYTFEAAGSYIQRIRLETAAYLLKFDDLPLKDIAWLTGYDSYPSFSTTFNNKFDRNPLAYRNHYQNKRVLFASDAQPYLKTYLPATRYYFWRVSGKERYPVLIQLAIKKVNSLPLTNNNLFDMPAMTCRCPDMPGITPGILCRWDAGFLVSINAILKFHDYLINYFPDVLYQDFPAGKYCIFKQENSGAESQQEYENAFAVILKNDRLQLRLGEAYSSYLIDGNNLSYPKQIFIPVC